MKPVKLVWAIRAVAATGKQFDRNDLPRRFTVVARAQMLYQLYRRGELRQVTKGKPGWNSAPPVYQKSGDAPKV
jgi:hypothetical protein